jgi:DNA helicase HerA-like ATPase
MLYEKLGAFYLGREYDIGADQLLERPLMYDARDLTTHAACVGMTGSGKTGLCVDLLEEAAIDHVPAIIIDPKGDITNLLLTFYSPFRTCCPKIFARGSMWMMRAAKV